MTTDLTELRTQIALALASADGVSGPSAVLLYGDRADAVLPVMRRAQAEALRQVALEYWGRDGDPDYPGTSGDVRHVLTARADKIERSAT